jgi:hypothetical protein
MISQSPNEDLTSLKFKKGHQIKNAIEEIIYNLEKFDDNHKVDPAENKVKSMYQTALTPFTRSNRPSRSTKKHPSIVSNQKHFNQTFLPKVEKQKVLEKFIDMSTADMFNSKKFSSTYASNMIGNIPYPVDGKRNTFHAMHNTYGE